MSGQSPPQPFHWATEQEARVLTMLRQHPDRIPEMMMALHLLPDGGTFVPASEDRSLAGWLQTLRDTIATRGSRAVLVLTHAPWLTPKWIIVGLWDLREWTFGAFRRPVLPDGTFGPKEDIPADDVGTIEAFQLLRVQIRGDGIWTVALDIPPGGPEGSRQ